MKAVVTGGAGFIGSHLAAALVERGDEVHVLDDLSTGRVANVPRGATLHRGCVTDPALLARVFVGASVVFHHAAIASVAQSIQAPLRTHEVTATGTVRVLASAQEAGVERVVFAASASAYGDPAERPCHERVPPAPLSPYAAAKLAGEQYCRVFHELGRVKTTVFRYFNVYGPRQPPEGSYAPVVPRFFEAAHAGRPLEIYGTGERTRDFVHVSDVVRANLLAADGPGSAGRPVNIGTGRATSLNELARSVLDVTGARSGIVHHASRTGEIEHSVADVQAARDALGFEARVPLRDGLADLARAFVRCAS